nr:hypothetical protein pmam_228 [Pithovirus mammoth]
MKNPSYFFVTSYKIWVFEQKLFLLDLGEIIISNTEFSGETQVEKLQFGDEISGETQVEKLQFGDEISGETQVEKLQFGDEISGETQCYL